MDTIVVYIIRSTYTENDEEPVIVVQLLYVYCILVRAENVKLE